MVQFAYFFNLFQGYAVMQNSPLLSHPSRLGGFFRPFFSVRGGRYGPERFFYERRSAWVDLKSKALVSPSPSMD